MPAEVMAGADGPHPAVDLIAFHGDFLHGIGQPGDDLGLADGQRR